MTSISLPRARPRARRRRRLRRPRHRDQARRARLRRLPRRRQGPERRRHLARQHLPRCGVRRAQPALLVQLRAQPRVVAVLLPPAGDPGLPRAHRPRLGRARPVPLRRHRRGRRLGRGGGRLARRHRPRRGHRGHPGDRVRRALGAQAAGDRGHRLLRRRDLPLGPLEPRLRPHRQAGGRHRHRRLGDPDRARGGQAGRAPRRLPAHRSVGDAARRPPLHGDRAVRVPPPAVRAEGLPHRHLLGSRVLRPRVHDQPQAGRAGEEAGAAEHRARHLRPRAAQGGHAQLPDRLQAHPDLQRLLPRPRLRPRRPGHRRHPRDHADGHRHRRRHRARGRRDRRGDRLLHDRAADRRAREGPRRSHARRLLARDRHGGVQGHHDRRLPQPVPDRRSQHRPRTLLDGVHHREPDRLHPLGAAADGRARDRHRRADAAGAGRLERRRAATDEAHRVEHRRLRELVPRLPRPQHHPVAAHHVRVPRAVAHLRPRRVRRHRTHATPTTKENVA